jgi:hypothetical protein
MDKPLKEHIRYLEERIHTLSGNLMDAGLPKVEQNRLEAELRAAQLALTHYRAALALEKALTEQD